MLITRKWLAIVSGSGASLCWLPASRRRHSKVAGWIVEKQIYEHDPRKDNLFNFWLGNEITEKVEQMASRHQLTRNKTRGRIETWTWCRRWRSGNGLVRDHSHLVMREAGGRRGLLSEAIAKRTGWCAWNVPVSSKERRLSTDGWGSRTLSKSWSVSRNHYFHTTYAL